MNNSDFQPLILVCYLLSILTEVISNACMCKPRGSLVGIAVKVGAGVVTATTDVAGMYFGLIIEVLGIVEVFRKGMTDDVVIISISVIILKLFY